MPANLKEPFNPSCCDGGFTSNQNSCQPCGCDAGADHRCEQHKFKLSNAELNELYDLLNDLWDFTDDYSDVNDGDDGKPVPNKAMSLNSRINDAIEHILGVLPAVKNYVE